MPLTMSRLGVSLCPVDGVVEDREVPDRVSDGSTVVHESHVTKNVTFWYLHFVGVVEDREFLTKVGNSSM